MTDHPRRVTRVRKGGEEESRECGNEHFHRGRSGSSIDGLDTPADGEFR